MNARQMKKRLKKQIDKIQSDNRLMRNIIADSPTMQELYDAYNKPLKNVVHTTMQFQEFRAKRMIPISRANDRKKPVVVEGFQLTCERGVAYAQTERWIPVSERLPSENGCYLVSTTGANNDIIDIAYYTKEIWHKASHIKAWMPLPEPYRAESEDNENVHQV